MFPLYIGVAPFALVYGSLSASLGHPLTESMGLSLLVFAGASQIAFIQMQSDGAGTIVTILTALAINSRMLLYSLALSPRFQSLSLVRRSLYAYLLTDQAFVVSSNAFEKSSHWNFKAQGYFYLGAGISLWFLWQTMASLGWWLGLWIPDNLNLDFFIPLTFLALASSHLADPRRRKVFIGAGLLALVSEDFPYHLGLLFSMVVATAFGWWLERRQNV